MPRQPTQREVVLNMLRDRGGRGVHSFEFYEARMPRAAATICQLRKDGARITSTPEKSPHGAPGCRYRLVGEVPLKSSPAVPPTQTNAGAVRVVTAPPAPAPLPPRNTTPAVAPHRALGRDADTAPQLDLFNTPAPSRTSPYQEAA